jgi:hypothetical protein
MLATMIRSRQTWMALPRRAGTLALAAMLAWAMADAAAAQSFVRADCLAVAGAAAPTRFDSPEHLRWYQRFWTGSCDGLPWNCWPGSPNWNDIVTQVVAKAPPALRPVALAASCRLGFTVGFEWSRDKKVRRIDTADLFRFGDQLSHAGDVMAVLQQLQAEARRRVGS